MKGLTALRTAMLSLLALAAGTVQPVQLTPEVTKKINNMLNNPALKQKPNLAFNWLLNDAKNDPQTAETQNFAAQIVQDTYERFDTLDAVQRAKMLEVFKRLLNTQLLRDEQKAFLRNNIIPAIDGQVQALDPQTAHLEAVQDAAVLQATAAIQAPVQQESVVQQAPVAAVLQAPQPAVAQVQPAVQQAPVAAVLQVPQPAIAQAQPAVVPAQLPMAIAPVAQQPVVAQPTTAPAITPAQPVAVAVPAQLPIAVAHAASASAVAPLATIPTAQPAPDTAFHSDLEETIKALYSQMQDAEGKTFAANDQANFGAALVNAFNGVVELQSYMSQLLTTAQDTPLLSEAQQEYVTNTMIPNLDQVTSATPAKTLEQAVAEKDKKEGKKAKEKKAKSPKKAKKGKKGNKGKKAAKEGSKDAAEAKATEGDSTDTKAGKPEGKKGGKKKARKKTADATATAVTSAENTGEKPAQASKKAKKKGKKR